MTPGCVSQTDRGLALTSAATRICGRALPETCSFAAEGRDDGWAPRRATDPRALGRGPAAAAVCSEPGSARAPRDLPTLSPHPEAPRPARLGQEAQRAGGAAPGRSGAPHLRLRGRPRGAAALQCSLSPQWTSREGRDRILAFITSMTTEEASRNVYKRALCSSRAHPLVHS